MAKREREEEFEVSEVVPLQPLSRLHSPLSTTIFTNISATIRLLLYDIIDEGGTLHGAC